MIRLIVSCLLGILTGVFLPTSVDVNPLFSIVLPVLLFSVGLSLGNISILNLVKQNQKLLALPVLSLIGSIVFSLIYALIFGVNIKETVLAGSAMGFYSLPAILVTTKVNVMAGSLLLITNMIRESITIILAPLIVKIFGKQSVIAIGGATTMDVSLAAIKEAAGDEYVPIAVLNGLILTIVVPFVTTLFINL